MKLLILGFVVAISAPAVAMDAPAQFMNDALTSAQQILSLKSTSAQEAQLCALFEKDVDINSVGAGLLGSYATLSTDQTGVANFIKLVPSIVVTKVAPQLSSASGSFTVGDTSTDNGDGTYSVDVTITTSNGSSYDGTAIVETHGSSFLLVDVQYLGFSGVSYYGGQLQGQISNFQNSDPNTPVSDEVKSLKGQSGFVNCP